MNNEMNLRHIRQFAVLAQELHFGRAAAELGIAQPQLSRSVQMLEQSMGVQLLERTTRNIQLSTAGQAFLEQAHKLLAQADLAQHVAQRTQASGMAKVRISFVAPALDILPDVLRRFRSEWPDVPINLSRNPSDRQLENLRKGALDIGLISATRDHSGLDVHLVRRCPYIAVMPADWAIAKKSSVRLSDLAEYPFLMNPQSQDQETHTTITMACRDAGFTPKVASEAYQAYAMETLVAAGVGLTLQPDMWKAFGLKGVAHVPLRDAPDYLHWDLLVASMKGASSPAMTSLIDMLRNLS